MKRPLIALLLCLSLVFSVLADSTGPNSPATSVDDASTGSISWANPENAGASDSSYATAALNVVDPFSHYLKCTGFGFSIPAGATINGILVEVQAKINAGAVRLQAVQLVIGGSIVGTSTPSFVTVTTTEAYLSFGSASDLWTLTPTRSDINDSGFGVVMQGRRTSGTPTASVNHVRITVTYTPAASGNPRNGDFFFSPPISQTRPTRRDYEVSKRFN